MSDTISLPPKGIGGWLILFVIGLIITPFRIGYILLNTHWPMFNNETWRELTTLGTDHYHPLWAPLLIFETVGNLIIIALGLITLRFLVLRSRRTPTLAIIFIGWTAMFVVIDHLLGGLIPTIAAQSNSGSDQEIIRSIISCAIWIPYFLVSKRVKATFVE